MTMHCGSSIRFAPPWRNGMQNLSELTRRLVEAQVEISTILGLTTPFPISPGFRSPQAAMGVLRGVAAGESRYNKLEMDSTPEFRHQMKLGRRTWLPLACALLIMAIFVSASWVAPLASASHLISVYSELRAYKYCLTGAAAGVVVFWIFTGRNAPHAGLSFSRLLVLLAFAVSIVAIAIVWSREGDHLFLRWTLRRIPTDAWAQIGHELSSMEPSPENGWSLQSQTLPRIFEWVGLRNELSGGVVNRQKSPHEVYVAYGYKARRWGVYLGSGDTLRVRWRRAQIVEVQPNLFIFVTED